jgi:hypothetical protein
MDEFYALSQITITIAGFAALFSILKPRDSEWTDLDKLNLVRFYIMIELACLISIVSFLPIILLGYFNTEISYRLSFFFCFVFFLLYNIYALKRNKRYSGKLDIGGFSTISIMTIGMFLLLFSILSSLNLIGTNYKTNYLILLYILFVINIYFFIRLIYFTIRKE